MSNLTFVVGKECDYCQFSGFNGLTNERRCNLYGRKIKEGERKPDFCNAKRVEIVENEKCDSN